MYVIGSVVSSIVWSVHGTQPSSSGPLDHAALMLDPLSLTFLKRKSSGVPVLRVDVEELEVLLLERDIPRHLRHRLRERRRRSREVVAYEDVDLVDRQAHVLEALGRPFLDVLRGVALRLARDQPEQAVLHLPRHLAVVVVVDRLDDPVPLDAEEAHPIVGPKVAEMHTLMPSLMRERTNERAIALPSAPRTLRCRETVFREGSS